MREDWGSDPQHACNAHLQSQHWMVELRGKDRRELEVLRELTCYKQWQKSDPVLNKWPSDIHTCAVAFTCSHIHIHTHHTHRYLIHHIYMHTCTYTHTYHMHLFTYIHILYAQTHTKKNPRFSRDLKSNICCCLVFVNLIQTKSHLG